MGQTFQKTLSLIRKLSDEDNTKIIIDKEPFFMKITQRLSITIRNVYDDGEIIKLYQIYDDGHQVLEGGIILMTLSIW